ncbi:MAG: hypothetical protein AAFW70_01175 [Cyanobacteria bacterium J06635_10]
MSKNNETNQQQNNSNDPDLTMVERWELQDKLENEIAAEKASYNSQDSNTQDNNQNQDNVDGSMLDRMFSQTGDDDDDKNTQDISGKDK